MEKSKKGGCCTCKSDLKKEVKTLVKEGTKPTAKEHANKKDEVEKAFTGKK